MGATFCCDEMRAKVDYRCPDHADPHDCPDNLVVRRKDGSFGLPIHDGGSSAVGIDPPGVACWTHDRRRLTKRTTADVDAPSGHSGQDDAVTLRVRWLLFVAFLAVVLIGIASQAISANDSPPEPTPVTGGQVNLRR